MKSHIQQALNKVVQGVDLSRDEAMQVFLDIMSGNATDAQIAGLITALRIKKESVEEITGAALAMRQKMTRVELHEESGVRPSKDAIAELGALLDTCGTGGTGSDAFNVSTAVSFVVAGCNIKVAKHGNRGVSGPCGSADVFEALGVGLDLTAEQARRCLLEVGIVFLFAPHFHRAMKYAAAVRKELGIRTIFNILGPLCNPASANVQLLGVFSEELTEVMATVLKNLGIRRALVVHGMDSLDEISISTKTKVSEVKDGEVRNYFLSPHDFGIQPAAMDALRAGPDAHGNAQIVLSILNGEKGPRRDIVAVNAAAALVAAGKATDFSDGMKLANLSIDSGYALRKLELLREYSRKQ